MRTWLNFIVCSLLALLVIVERAIPCVDDSLTQENDTCAAEMALSGDHHDDAASDVHHCDHCTCSCHIPALETQKQTQTVSYALSRPYATFSPSLPASPVSIPDHIPLV